MFEAYYDSRKWEGILILQKEFHPFPIYGEKVPVLEQQKTERIAMAEPLLGKEWPILRATDYMMYCTVGDRVVYEGKYFERRDGLGKLMLAEYLEQKGRFWDDLVDLLWAILEESTWALPSQNAIVETHYSKWGKMYLDREKIPLHDPEHPMRLELFSAATGAQLSVLYYLFKKQLDEVTPLLARRIEVEVEKRLIDRFLDGYYWWSGLEQRTCNWNPWIVANTLTAAAFVCKDEEKRRQVVVRSCLLLDHFLKDYHEDGGCDEGPSYWDAAGAALGDCLSILSDLTGGELQKLFAEPLIQNIMAYIYRVNLVGDYYTNFADSDVVVKRSGAEIYRLGKAVQDPVMVQFGLALEQRRRAETDYRPGSAHTMFYRGMRNLFAEAELDGAQGESASVESVYLSGIQLMVERQEANDNQSMILAAKGGHNGENHNHNDVGTFLLYADGEPVICDIGRGQYNAQTFNEHRYELRQTQSLYHNLPEINGVAQKNGEEFTASDVSYRKENGTTVFAMNLEQAYPAECGAEHWKRSFTYDRAERTILLTDSAVFAGEGNRVCWSFMTPKKPNLEEGAVVLCPDSTSAVRMRYADGLCAEVEFVDFTGDAKLNKEWNGEMYRVRIFGEFGGECHCAFVFTEE